MLPPLQDRLLIAFDVDGTLVDTRDLVTKAYADQGVTMPDEAWGQPWYSWLPNTVGSLSKAIQVHEAKNKSYLKVLTDGDLPVLPATDLAKDLMAEGAVDVGFLTGASDDAVQAILTRLGIDTNLLWGSSMSYDDKLDWLIVNVWKRVIYIDDDARLIQHINSIPWCYVRGVHYVGQTLEELKEAIKWTP